MRRNLMWALIALSSCALLALVGWLSLPPVYDPQGPPLTVNGVPLGATQREVEAVLGPLVSWESEFAQYGEGKRRTSVGFDLGPMTVNHVGGSVLAQGTRTLIRAGTSQAEVERVLGAEWGVDVLNLNTLYLNCCE